MNQERKMTRPKTTPSLIFRILSVVVLFMACMWLLTALSNKDKVSLQSGGDFVQGLCGQTIRESVTLTEDIGPCTGDGIIIKKDGIMLDGDGYKILGSGNGNGVIVKGKKDITVKNLFIQGFEEGIMVQQAAGSNISTNRVRENGVGIFLSRASNASVTNNVVSENSVGIQTTSSANEIFHNMIINNQIQIDDVGGNIWEDPFDHFGNFWGNYWGEDDGSDGRIAGDFIGDTRLPHEGVDFSPVLDLMKLGSFLCGDWWTV
jgi:parallel beta-helix repeat protein